MANINLPFDIIDTIITTNPNTIISTYNKIKSNLEEICKSKETIETRKRKKQNDTQNNPSKLLDYIINNKLTYFNKSSYFKYFNNINIVENIFILLTKYIKKTDIPELDIIDYLENVVLNKFILEDKKNTLSNKFINYMNVIINIYELQNYNELPDFIKLYLLLKCSNYLPLQTEFFKYKNENNKITAYLDIIIENYTNKNGEQYLYTEMILKCYKYLLTPEYKFILLFSINLGMGYNFIVGYDILIDGLIGFIEGGSSGQEYDYNKILIEKYFKMNKQQRQNKYHINCNNNNKKYNLLENIKKYISILFTIDISIIPNYYNYFNDMKLNILNN
jgi:hypothetical protein